MWHGWSKLINNKDIQSQYSIAVKDKFRLLISSEDEKQIDHKLGLPADHIYNVLAKAHIDAAKETIPRKTKTQERCFVGKGKSDPSLTAVQTGSKNFPRKSK